MKKLLFLLGAIVCVSCSAKKTDDKAAAEGAADAPAPTHAWYAFSEGGFAQVTFPANVPEVDFAPWTQTLRVCDSADDGQGRAFFLVNRLGLLSFSADGAELFRDAVLFAGSTADTLVNTESGLVFHRFADTFFAGPSPTPTAASRTILTRFDGKRFHPLLTKGDAGLPPDAEVTAVSCTEDGWYCQIRREPAEDAPQVSYRVFLLPKSPQGPVTSRAATQDGFWGTLRDESFEDAAPQKIRGLLTAIPAELSLRLVCLFPGQETPRRFSRSVESAPTVNGYAVCADTYAIAVFEDGTVYFQGALLPGRAAFGEVLGFSLPELPPGFVYGNCVVAGGKFYAAWEEKRFFETGRSGFIAVNLDTLLYGG